MPWIVRNLLRGTLTFRGLPVSIPPKGQVDLDGLIGRERAEVSNQILVAFEEGYLQTVTKADGRAQEPVLAVGAGPNGLTSAGLDQALASLRASLAGDMKTMLDGLKVARARLRDEKEKVLVDETLTDSEIRARLACLDAEERELEKNFQDIGKKTTGATGGGVGVAEKADLLSSM